MYEFPPTKRLLVSNEFKQVFITAEHRFREGPLSLNALHNHKTHARIGIVAPKKLLKRAVDRNRLKRVVRDEFRRYKWSVPCDLVLALKQKIHRDELHSTTFVVSVKQAFDRLERYSIRLANTTTSELGTFEFKI